MPDAEGDAEERQVEADGTDPEAPLTTDTGGRVEATDNALSVGEQGPTLLEDFHAREKITHFDHEPIAAVGQGTSPPVGTGMPVPGAPTVGDRFHRRGGPLAEHGRGPDRGVRAAHRSASPLGTGHRRRLRPTCLAGTRRRRSAVVVGGTSSTTTAECVRSGVRRPRIGAERVVAHTHHPSAPGVVLGPWVGQFLLYEP